MARYYFHMKSKHYELLDDEGKVLRDACEAYLQARAIVEKCQSDVWARDDQDRWWIEICGDSGSPEFFVSFPRQVH
jgi:sulfur transfer protein SufE